ncbi:hypothetical protein ABZ819_05210 [Streptomyces venezuelae]|uniref:hypothetical protein n=1 Tax=Streptomyces venezuelae TaxID=54571 RepID=UPI0034168DE2
MEVLLIAVGAWLAFTAGAQSEQAKLGVSPAQRDQMREHARHEKAVQRIAQKHGVDATPPTAGQPALNSPQYAGEVPGTFLSGYRSGRPSGPPLSHRAGQWAAQGVSWGQHTSRDAWRKHKQRRKTTRQHSGPDPVLVPLPPSRPPNVPPMPSEPPTAGSEKDPAGATAKPDSATPPAAPAKAPPKPPEAPATNTGKAPATEDDKRPEPEDDSKPLSPAAADIDESPKEPQPESPPPAPAPPAAEADTPRPDTTPPADTPRGVGRMAAEVTYESVMDESDELSAMCSDDLHTYDRIKKRAEREVGRGDELAAQVLAAGFGPTIHAIVVRCREQYQIIHNAIDDLKSNTIAQAEAVVVAKNQLAQGQGVYAGIAKDMEDVAERESYISDAIDAEDANPEAEHYETKAAV